MSRFLPFQFHNNTFVLTSGKSIFWEEERSLIMSDLHLGKSGHFRKSGIGIPQTVMVEDMQRLISQVQFFKPDRLIIVGDLFHSHINKEHELFSRWRNDFSFNITLIRGNHDILRKEWYQQAGIDVSPESLQVGKFKFVHDIDDCTDEE